MTIYCAVHLIGLASTCTNPVLYAFFNENLRRELEFFVDCLLPTMMRSQASSQRSNKSIRSQAAGANALRRLLPRRDHPVPKAVFTQHEFILNEYGEDKKDQEECLCMRGEEESNHVSELEMADMGISISANAV
jgi:hypothetical protein